MSDPLIILGVNKNRKSFAPKVKKASKQHKSTVHTNKNKSNCRPEDIHRDSESTTESSSNYYTTFSTNITPELSVSTLQRKRKRSNEAEESPHVKKRSNSTSLKELLDSQPPVNITYSPLYRTSNTNHTDTTITNSPNTAAEIQPFETNIPESPLEGYDTPYTANTANNTTTIQPHDTQAITTITELPLAESITQYLANLSNNYYLQTESFPEETNATTPTEPPPDRLLYFADLPFFDVPISYPLTQLPKSIPVPHNCKSGKCTSSCLNLSPQYENSRPSLDSPTRKRYPRMSAANIPPHDLTAKLQQDLQRRIDREEERRRKRDEKHMKQILNGVMKVDFKPDCQILGEIVSANFHYEDEEQEDEEQEDEADESELNILRESTATPQVHMVDGQIQLNPNSLKISRSSSSCNQNSPLTQFPGRPMNVTGKWSAIETQAFYQGLSEFGMDFMRIAETIPGRDRNQVAAKYKVEDKVNPFEIAQHLHQYRPSL